MRFTRWWQDILLWIVVAFSSVRAETCDIEAAIRRPEHIDHDALRMVTKGIKARAKDFEFKGHPPVQPPIHPHGQWVPREAMLAARPLTWEVPYKGDPIRALARYTLATGYEFSLYQEKQGQRIYTSGSPQGVTNLSYKGKQIAHSHVFVEYPSRTGDLVWSDILIPSPGDLQRNQVVPEDNTIVTNSPIFRRRILVHYSQERNQDLQKEIHLSYEGLPSGISSTYLVLEKDLLDHSTNLLNDLLRVECQEYEKKHR